MQKDKAKKLNIIEKTKCHIGSYSVSYIQPESVYIKAVDEQNPSKGDIQFVISKKLKSALKYIKVGMRVLIKYMVVETSNYGGVRVVDSIEENTEVVIDSRPIEGEVMSKLLEVSQRSFIPSKGSYQFKEGLKEVGNNNNESKSSVLTFSQELELIEFEEMEELQNLDLNYTHFNLQSAKKDNVFPSSSSKRKISTKKKQVECAIEKKTSNEFDELDLELDEMVSMALLKEMEPEKDEERKVLDEDSKSCAQSGGKKSILKETVNNMDDLIFDFEEKNNLEIKGLLPEKVEKMMTQIYQPPISENEEIECSILEIPERQKGISKSNPIIAPSSSMLEDQFFTYSESEHRPLDQASSNPNSIKIVEESKVVSLCSLTMPILSSDHNMALVVRVVKLYPIKSIASIKKDYFMCELIDKTGSIPCTVEGSFLKQKHVWMQEDEVIIIKNFFVRKGQKSKDKRMKDLEIKVTDESMIDEYQDDGSIPSTVIFSFSTLEDLLDQREGFTFDLVGIVVGMSTKTEIPLRAGGSTFRQLFKVIDDTNYEAEITVWRDLKNTEKVHLQDVIIFRNIKVNIYRGKNLSTAPDSRLILNPKGGHIRIERVLKYANFYRKNPLDDQISLKDSVLILPEIKCLNYIKKEASQLEKNPEKEMKIYQTIAYLKFFKGNMTYLKCPTPTCYKKAQVDEMIPELITCATCGFLPYGSKPDARYIGSAELVDGTSSISTTFSKEYMGRLFFGGCTAEEINEIRMLNQSYFKSILSQMSGRLMKFWIYPTFALDKKSSNKEIKYEVKRVEDYTDQMNNDLMYSIRSLALRREEEIENRKKKPDRNCNNKEESKGEIDGHQNTHILYQPNEIVEEDDWFTN